MSGTTGVAHQLESGVTGLKRGAAENHLYLNNQTKEVLQLKKSGYSGSLLVVY